MGTVRRRLFEAKQWLYRFIKYQWLRPKPWVDPTLAGKKVVVVGSAPVASRPVGLDGSYRLITINAAQQALERWGISKPDITVMMFNQIEGENTNAREVRRVLQAKRTGTLYLMLWRHGLSRLEAGLKRFDYGYDELHIIDRYRRVALVRAVSGILNFELDASTKYSNGVIAAMLALHSRASCVILSGINPRSSGHAYNSENLVRMHGDTDFQMLKTLMSLRCPIYTADPEVAETTGLPLWRGEPSEQEGSFRRG